MIYRDPLSAISKCPEEVWCMILDQASCPPIPLPSSSDLSWCNPMEPFHMHGSWNMISPARQVQLQRLKSRFTVFAVMGVCRDFYRIVHSCFPEWVAVESREEILKATAALRKTLKYRSAGYNVRQLQASPYAKGLEDMLLSDIDDREMLRVVTDLVKLCPRLRSFSYSASWMFRNGLKDICSALAGSCRNTLTVLDVRVHNNSLDDLYFFLEQCPRMAVLSLADDPGVLPAELTMSIPDAIGQLLSLRSISWQLSTSTASFLAKVQLPNLTHLNLHYDLDHGVGSDAIRAMLEPHGRQLRTLEIDPGIATGRDGGFAVNMLNYLPKLETFICDLHCADAAPLDHPRSSLRHVVCRSFAPIGFESRSGTVEVLRHTWEVTALMHSFYGPDFPNLRIIRCLDLQPPTSRTKWLMSKGYDFPEEYTALANTVAPLCADRNIRFEDCLGAMVKSNICPKYLIKVTSTGSGGRSPSTSIIPNSSDDWDGNKWDGIGYE